MKKLANHLIVWLITLALACGITLAGEIILKNSGSRTLFGTIAIIMTILASIFVPSSLIWIISVEVLDEVGRRRGLKARQNASDWIIYDCVVFFVPLFTGITLWLHCKSSPLVIVSGMMAVVTGLYTIVGVVEIILRHAGSLVRLIIWFNNDWMIMDLRDMKREVVTDSAKRLGIEIDGRSITIPENRRWQFSPHALGFLMSSLLSMVSERAETLSNLCQMVLGDHKISSECFNYSRKEQDAFFRGMIDRHLMTEKEVVEARREAEDSVAKIRQAKYGEDEKTARRERFEKKLARLAGTPATK